MKTLTLMTIVLTCGGAALAGDCCGSEKKASPEEAAQWLWRIEQRAAEVQTLQARVVYDRIQGLVGDQQRRIGRLVYVAGAPTRFAVHFDTLLMDGGRVEPQDRWWIYDGQWLVERLDDKKQFFKRRIHDAPGRSDPLAEGTGPFPVPLQARKDAMLARFTVTLVPAQPNDPSNSVHLQLRPRQAGGDYSLIDIWYDKRSLLPVRARTIHDKSMDEQVFLLHEARVNEAVDPSQIDTRTPSQRGEEGWLEEITGSEDETNTTGQTTVVGP